MMQEFHGMVAGSASVDKHYASDMNTMKTIDNIYSAATVIKENTCFHEPLQRKNIPDCLFRWPLISEEVTSAVNRQLQENVSIYDDSGIFGRFEHAWKKIHNQVDSFALLHNSGTNALQASYFAAGFKPGDEVGSLFGLCCWPC